MKVHKEQLEALGRLETEAYEERLVGFLQRTVSRARAAGAAEVAARVRVDVGEARALGLSTERQIAAYVAAWWVLGEGFAERIPAIGEALADGGRSADEKAQVLLGHLDGRAQRGEA